jgi:hypothetical protein
MSLSVTHLLLDSDSVPLGARSALRSAYQAPVEERRPYLETAARLLHRELGLDCTDARELVGLPAPAPCSP